MIIQQDIAYQGMLFSSLLIKRICLSNAPWNINPLMIPHNVVLISFFLGLQCSCANPTRSKTLLYIKKTIQMSTLKSLFSFLWHVTIPFPLKSQINLTKCHSGQLALLLWFLWNLCRLLISITWLQVPRLWHPSLIGIPVSRTMRWAYYTEGQICYAQFQCSQVTKGVQRLGYLFFLELHWNKIHIT